MIISFTTVFTIAASTLLAAVILALAGLLTARLANRRARHSQAQLDAAVACIAELDATLKATTAQVQELLAERERSNALPTRPSLREAVALSRHGASTEELVSTCRIGQSEAHLIQMLYGARQAGDVH
jgi:hypothetical protein